jgi:hypothetical protein
MTLNDFNLLDKDMQANAVWAGALLGQRTEKSYVVSLFSVSSFYVEVYYCTTTNTINYFSPFESIGHLAPYLKQIKIKRDVT